MKDVRGGGRKKIEGASPQQLHGDDDDEENNVTVCGTGMEVLRTERLTGEVDDDDENVGEEEEEEEEEEKERPKLDAGFYEIEDVRRKRIRKVILKGKFNILSNGRRGWPENANTWEPLENLQSCSDVIESFEDRLRSGNHKCYRKRKRKQGVSHTQAKKKQCSTSTSSLPYVRVGSGYRHFPSASLDNSSLSKSSLLESNEWKGDDHLNEVTNCPSNGVMGERLPENVSFNVLLENDHTKEVGITRSYVEGALAKKLNAGRILTHVSNAVVLDCDGPKEELQKAECLNLAQTSRCTGAKKRKLGSVRRFKQESTSNELGDAQNSIARCVIESGDKVGALGMEDVDSLGDDLGDKNNLDDSISPCSITKIIKAIGYSASVSNNIQDVSITFMAMRLKSLPVIAFGQHVNGGAAA
ncbi:hypothetical protein Scep_010423 [Stephania cephalantha]|uniref:Chromo domain-containing protein n=1 Tax=Stephania cephalantha TaxID=152367 RepID=A0AAP0JV36_9MAGN